MTIDKKRDGNNLEISLSGHLDTTSSPQLAEELENSLEGVKNLTFDLSDLSYISSAGLRVLLSTQKRMLNQGEMKIKNAGETVMEIFEVTGFTDILTIE